MSYIPSAVIFSQPRYDFSDHWYPTPLVSSIEGSNPEEGVIHNRGEHLVVVDHSVPRSVITETEWYRPTSSRGDNRDPP